VAWNRKNSAKKTHPIGLKKTNALGIYDMSGNVSEWTSFSFYIPTKYPKCNPTRELKPSSERLFQTRCPARGCHYYDLEYYPKLSSRAFRNKEQWILDFDAAIGIRLAQSVGDSRLCPMPAKISEPLCDNNHTPLDGSDDFFHFDVEIDHYDSMLTWIATDPLHTHGSYYEPFKLGPYEIGRGDFSFVISDSISNGFTTDPIYIKAPKTCSDSCELTISSIETICHNNGTALDCTDDVFYHKLAINGLNTTEYYLTDFPTKKQGLYNDIALFGPFQISQGAVNIEIKDSLHRCNATIKLEPSETCSDSIVLANVIMPDDFENNTWQVKLPNKFSILDLYIYNRWGSIVFKGGPSNYIWDGYYNGQILPSSVYVYYLKYKNKKNIVKTLFGDISLIR
jgi:gliding motility-associated-like protein